MTAPLYVVGSGVPGTSHRLSLADAVTTIDPGSRLAAAISDLGAGSGIRFQVTGGWSSTDWAGAHPAAIWRFRDIVGTQVDGGQWTLTADLRIRGAGPGDSSDTDVRLLICNEQDITSATVDGACMGMRFTTASRFGIVGLVQNGASSVNVGTTGSATAAFAEGIFGPHGHEATRVLVTPRTALLDSAGAYITNTNVNAAPINGCALGTGQLYVALIVGRSAATAGTVTVDVDAYLQLPYVVTAPT